MPNLTPEQLAELSKNAQTWFTTTYYNGEYEEWVKILQELGFTLVGGRWVKLIPSYSSTVKQTLTTAGAVAGTTATIYETVTAPVSSIIASNTGTSVTTSGLITATSSSVGLAACGAALGFTMGVNAFESEPEAWTLLSNIVFQTELDPQEIGQIARDTNALVMIKDGITYMAEDLVDAIRSAFFTIGADQTGVIVPEISGATANITITSTDAAPLYTKENIEKLLEAEGKPWTQEGLNALAEARKKYSSYGNISRQSNRVFISGYENLALSLPVDVTAERLLSDRGFFYQIKLPQRTNYDSSANFFFMLNSNGEITGAMSSSIGANYTTTIYYGDFSLGTQKRTIYSTNSIASAKYITISPTGEQGTATQTIEEVFPEWVKKAVTTLADTPEKLRRWLPVTLPETQVETEGNTKTATEAQTGVMPKAGTESATQIGTNTDTKTTTKTGEALTPTPLPLPLPTITPTPDDPGLIGGGGSLTGLANLYNPTLNQVKLFSRWLWGSDGLNLDQLKKLLQDPMQAIIGLHVLYATPTTGDARGIQVGYINSGVNSKIVTEQYITVDCGTVSVPEYYGDARDYSPFTQVYCYLPFIGIVELNADDVINSKLSIAYKVDVLTGTCLAQLKVQKYGLNAVLYTYTGNAAVQMPITSGSYLSTVASLIGTVGGVIATAATGGALAPVVAGAAAGAASGAIKSNVAMSGSLGANAGAMGIRKPYLIIKRQEQADASGYSAFYGLPTNKRVTLSEITGFCRVKDINLSVAGATEEEQQQIIALLKEGVIL